METSHYVMITIGIIIFFISLVLLYRFGKRKGYYRGFEDGYTNSPYFTEDEILETLSKVRHQRKGQKNKNK
ncbi:hypothetical protein [Haloplasma contractile]|uniref:DUF3951 domain-containing protein n=1 Tax=Haloplasma contractile SSD-17B TaxID=1033810 RepID=U2FJP7_9MOLU|nr:hypothetical protein [Haloplasma contractile]ERJ11479.1 hypothetical protein HLPCO_002391 [Haloplasma contractile SSD-17B]